ncbi:MAG: histidine kinase [Gemmatirosa sp.]|nr:histidine kinase [Gemmatirosa sp.]
MAAVALSSRLLHLAGFGTGIALYAMLGLMTLRVAHSAGGRRDRIPVATAILGLLWNAGALLLYGGRDVGLAAPADRLFTLLGAIAFGALGVLPAVVVQATLLGAAGWPRRAILVAAYALSGGGAVLHLWAAATGAPVPNRSALLLLTWGYAVVLPVLAVVVRRQPGNRAPLMAAALAAFAVMALHLSHHSSGAEPVGAELLGHHASIPLALVILYQDFRFALADVFLKRVLVAVALVVLGVAAHLFVVVPLVLPRLAADPASPLGTGLLLALWVAAALVAAPIRRLAWGVVDRVVLRRADYRVLREQVARDVQRRETAESTLDAVRDHLAAALGATAATWRPVDGPPDGAPNVVGRTVAPAQRGTAAVVAVPTAEAPHFELVVGGLAPGRRLLSDDVALLEQVSVTAARRIDALRVAHERYEREAREQDILRLATEAELRALRAQLNPHFLFNALTTIGYLVQAAPDRALDTLHRLTELLRAVLRPASELLPLGDELEIVSAYLAIEHARFEERLRVTIDVSDDARGALLPPLLLQPLVENAVKHGVSPLRAGGDVVVRARVEPDAAGERRLHVVVSDTGAGATADALARGREDGVGLRNVERRLTRHYGGAASLAFRTAPGSGTTIELWIPLSPRAAR